MSTHNTPPECEGARVRRCDGARVRRCDGARVRRCALLIAALALTCSYVVSGFSRTVLAQGLGTPISEAEIAAWDISILPDGTGLPPGSGTPADGARIFATKCAVCHG